MEDGFSQIQSHIQIKYIVMLIYSINNFNVAFMFTKYINTINKYIYIYIPLRTLTVIYKGIVFAMKYVTIMVRYGGWGECNLLFKCPNATLTVLSSFRAPNAISVWQMTHCHHIDLHAWYAWTCHWLPLKAELLLCRSPPNGFYRNSDGTFSPKPRPLLETLTIRIVKENAS